MVFLASNFEVQGQNVIAVTDTFQACMNKQSSVSASTKTKIKKENWYWTLLSSIKSFTNTSTESEKNAKSNNSIILRYISDEIVFYV